jgi:hypothetical protein
MVEGARVHDLGVGTRAKKPISNNFQGYGE